MVLEEAGRCHPEMAVVIWTPFGGFHVPRNTVLTLVCVVFCPLLLAKRIGFFEEQLLAIYTRLLRQFVENLPGIALPNCLLLGTDVPRHIDRVQHALERLEPYFRFPGWF